MDHLKLARVRLNTRRQPRSVLFSRMDLPARGEKHGVQDGNLLGQGRHSREAGEDVGEDFGKGMGKAGDGRVEKRGDGGVPWADELGDGNAFSETLAAFGEEVEEEGIQRAGWQAVFVGRHERGLRGGEG